MSLEDAYLYMFNILSDYYNRYMENDSLASILSDMDCNIFTDGKPADPAIYDDWIMAVSPFVDNGCIKRSDIMLALRSFLVYYKQEFGYELESVIAYVNGMIADLNLSE